MHVYIYVHVQMYALFHLGLLRVFVCLFWFLVLVLFCFSFSHTHTSSRFLKQTEIYCLGREDEVQVRLSAQLMLWVRSSCVQIPVVCAGLNMGSLQILRRKLQPNNSDQCLVFHSSDKMLSHSASHGASSMWNLGLTLEEATGQMIVLKDLETKKGKGGEEKDSATCHLGMMSFKGLNVIISSSLWRRQEPNPALLLSSIKYTFYPSGKMCYFMSISVSS